MASGGLKGKAAKTKVSELIVELIIIFICHHIIFSCLISGQRQKTRRDPDNRGTTAERSQGERSRDSSTTSQAKDL